MEWVQVGLSVLGGIVTLSTMIGGYLYRELKEADKETSKELSQFKEYVAGRYAPREEVISMFNQLRLDLKETIRDAKDEIKELIEAKVGRD